MSGAHGRWSGVAKAIFAALSCVGVAIMVGAIVNDSKSGWLHFPVFVVGFLMLIGGLGLALGPFDFTPRKAREPENTLVHGAARPATETEAQAAARGAVKAREIHEQTFDE